MTNHKDLIHTYIARADTPDTDAYLALFAATAVVADDGHRYTGLDEIRSWRGGTVPFRTEILDVVDLDATAVRARISGEFAGSPVMLTFTFAFGGDDRITSLTIAPSTTPVA